MCFLQFWNGNGEDCDGPLCHRMVFGLQGTAYYVDEALSYSGGPALNYDSTYWDCGYGPSGARSGRAGKRAAANNDNTTSTTPPGGRGRGARQGSQRPTRQHKSARAAHATLKAAAVASGYGGKDNTVFSTDRPIYLGYAYVLNGIIFGLSGQTKEHWQSGGTFEWCMDFVMDDIASDGTFPGISAGYPWVTDKEMKMTFFKAPSYPSSYYSN